MEKVKTPIADAFREWEKKATFEEKQKFCNDVNAIALAIRTISEVQKENGGIA